jgi:hypothetical protein
MEHCHRAIGVDGDVLAFMDEVVVSRALSDDSEIIDEGDIDLAILKKTLEALLSNACRLVLHAGGFADADNLLRLEMGITADVVALMVNETSVCSGPTRSTTSPAPPAAQGTKTESAISVLSLTCTAA